MALPFNLLHRKIEVIEEVSYRTYFLLPSDVGRFGREKGREAAGDEHNSSGPQTTEGKNVADAEGQKDFHEHRLDGPTGELRYKFPNDSPFNLKKN
jgi:hypothetical protein